MAFTGIANAYALSNLIQPFFTQGLFVQPNKSITEFEYLTSIPGDAKAAASRQVQFNLLTGLDYRSVGMKNPGTTNFLKGYREETAEYTATLKEFQATIFHRDMALAVGIPSTAIFYGILFLTGATITASLEPIGGLLVFSLILNPASAAYQLTYSMKRMFLLSAGFGILSGLIGLLISYLFNIPSGATIVIVSSAIFGIATLVSPKKKVKRWQEQSLKTGGKP